MRISFSSVPLVRFIPLGLAFCFSPFIIHLPFHRRLGESRGGRAPTKACFQCSVQLEFLRLFAQTHSFSVCLCGPWPFATRGGNQHTRSRRQVLPAIESAGAPSCPARRLVSAALTPCCSTADSMHDIGFGRAHYRNKELETRLTRSARGLRVCGVEVTLAPHAHACTPRGQLPGGNQNKVATAWKAQDKKDTCKEAMAAAIDASCCLTLAGSFAGCCSCSTAPPCRSSLTIRPPAWVSSD